MKRFGGSLAGWPVPGWLPGSLILLGTILAYQPVWKGGFLWDDDMYLTKNRMLSEAGGWKQIWFSPDSPNYYPMLFTSFRLERALWGLNPAGYHWVNLLLHAVSAVLIWRVLRRFAMPGAWLAGAIFALHPVNVESVAWISERKNTLAMFFFLLSLFWYVRFDEQSSARSQVPKGGGRNLAPPSRDHASHPVPSSRFYWLSLGAFMLALLSKTAVAPLPLLLLGLAWWRRGKVTSRDVGRTVPFFVASLVLGLITVWFERTQMASQIARDDSFWSRLAGAGWAVWFYLYKALLPLNLIHVYPRWQIDPARALAYVPAALAAGTFLWLWCYRRRWGKPWLLCAGFYVVMLLPVLGFVNIGFMSYSLVADRWQYFAILAPIAAAAALFTSSFKARGSSFGASRLHLGGSLSPLGLFLAALLLAALGALTWRQSGLYVNAETLWQGTRAANQRCWLAYYHLGLLYLERGSLDEAIVQFQDALRIKPHYAEARNNLGAALLQKGALDEAMAQYQEALRTDPAFADAHDNLGAALLQMGRVDDAIAEHQKALQLQPGLASAHSNLGVALFRKGRVDEAIAECQTALQSDPEYGQAHNNLGTALIAEGRMAEALTQYEEALRLQPADPNTQNNLALLLATCTEASLRNGDKALQLARQANDLAGGRNPGVLRTLAAALAETRRFGDAVQTAQTALELARAAGQQELAAHLTGELKRYEAGLPLRQ